MRRVRLMTWCPDSVGGMHLPAFAAAEAGLFAERGIEVEFVRASSAPEAVAAGEADFGLTAAVHVLTAQSRARDRLPVRFVAAFHQRNPIAAVVRDDSGRRAWCSIVPVRRLRFVRSRSTSPSTAPACSRPIACPTRSSRRCAT